MSAADTVDDPDPPAYGRGALCDVLPSLLAALGGPGGPCRPCGPDRPVLDVPAARGICLLVVDGLSWQRLARHSEDAPFLAGLAAASTPIDAGFPATTATSLTSLGTGLPPGEHGIVGYTFAPAGRTTLVNALSWRTHAATHSRDLRRRYPPERIQPNRTALEVATSAGISVTVLAPPAQRDSGLSRAAFRGGRFRSVHALGDLAAAALDALGAAGPVLCYAYHGDLDLVGHLRGPGSPAWRLQLAHVDALAAAIAARLPAQCRLVVTADHGMVAVEPDELVDADAEPGLRDGVRRLAGDVRARHVYTLPGAAADVRAAWTACLGAGAWIRSRDEAIAAGWFGPRVLDVVRPRIGDLVVAARGSGGVIASRAEPTLARMRGQHGSLTPVERQVPFLVAG